MGGRGRKYRWGVKGEGRGLQIRKGMGKRNGLQIRGGKEKLK